MDELKHKRSVNKGKITRCKTFIDSFDKGKNNVHDIDVREIQLDSAWKDLNEIQIQIISLTDENERDNEEEYFIEIEEKYLNTKSAMVRLKSECSSSTNATSTPRPHEANGELTAALDNLATNQTMLSTILDRLSQNSSDFNRTRNTDISTTTMSNSNARLPCLNIPTFSGEYHEWPAFKDLFDSLVHSDTMLNNSVKLQYLKMSLKGEAASLIKHLATTDANYKEAYDELNSVYNKENCIIDAYIKLIMDIPTLNTTSAQGLKNLYNSVNVALRGLKAMNIPVESWDALLIFIISNKLDAESKQLWIRSKPINKCSDFKTFKEFLEKRTYELEMVQSSSKRNIIGNPNPRKHIQTQSSYSITIISCQMCQANHRLFKCQKYNNLNSASKKEFLLKHKLCINCTKQGHTSSNCTSRGCFICNEKHHTSIHEAIKNISTERNGDSQRTLTHRSFVSQVDFKTVFLPTVICLVEDYTGELQPCRALLDSGSQVTMISELCVQRLRLKRKHSELSVIGVGSLSSIKTKGSVELNLHSRINDFRLSTNAIILNKLTSDLVFKVDYETEVQEFIKNIELADPNFYKSNTLDIILSADIFFNCIDSDKINHSSGRFSAIKTTFGWIVTGIADKFHMKTTSLHTCIDIDDSLRRFWELENVNSPSMLSQEEMLVEDLYNENISRNDEGRYIVKLPFNDKKELLGNSRDSALKSFLYLEKKLSNDQTLKKEYSNFIQEYIQLNHARKTNDNKGYFYLPHHAVMKESSTTTRLRVVFDASRKSSTGLSLNDTLFVGPTIQAEGFNIILNFRKHKIAYSADIAKMYRQILMHDDDVKYQRIFWRSQPSDKIDEFELLTVTYGTKPAPFLATRTLRQLAIDEDKSYPLAAKVLLNSFYIDDLLHGSNTLQEAIQTQDELINLLRRGGFELRKWSSNSDEFISHLHCNYNNSEENLIVNKSTTKALGILWETNTDTLAFSFKVIEVKNNITKRQMLSEIAKVYDPLGLIAPVVVSLKIIMQRIWLTGLNWDETVPENIHKEFFEIRSTLILFNNFRIDRWLGYKDNFVVELHAFADASKVAYAGVVYLRTIYPDKSIHIRLVSSKTRVAPLKELTIPKLELCAVVLATDLLAKCKEALNIDNVTLWGWTDSTIVLAWLSSEPRKWKTFISHRTAKVLDILPRRFWGHVRSDQNPADFASRGLHPAELISNDMWWNGPQILYNDLQFGSTRDVFETAEEIREKISLKTVIQRENNILFRYSSLQKLKNVIGWCLRWRKRTSAADKTLTTEELNSAMNSIIRIAQNSSFAVDIERLKSSKQLQNGSRIKNLNPFIDDQHILRVGGRLSQSLLSYEEKHPIILGKNCPLAKLIVSELHERYYHAGKQLLLRIVSSKYWIQHSKSLIKKHIRSCIVCTRYKASTCQQQMGNLPSTRIQPSPPFFNTGVDYAGPFYVKSWKGRNAKVFKGYVSLFVCLCTKAIHLELVSDMSTEAFIAAINRFVSRRGLCRNLYSDNGSNFIGAKNKLNELYKLIKSSDHFKRLQQELSSQSINWSFIPPSAPHFGGIWEAGVKQMKIHLNKTINSNQLTFEEFSTILSQVEACLNSRPLVTTCNDDSTLDVLTPGHFLIGRPLLSMPQGDFTDSKVTHLSRWQFLQQLTQRFWRTWSLDYLKQLQIRKKWTNSSYNLKVNDLVIIKENNLPACSWLLGRVEKVFLGKDKLVRVATIKTKNGQLTRPIHKLVLLTPDN